MSELRAPALPSSRLLLGLVMVGVLLRLAFFWPERSLWLDEALLASNLVERDYAGLLEPLAGEQAAPPAFLITAKASANWWGGSEAAFRLPSLLASLAALVAFLMLVRRSLSQRAGALAIALFALLPGLILYGAELKPYAGDAFFAVLLLLLFERARERSRASGWVPLAIVGMLAPWFSFSSVFVLAGAGVVFAIASWKQERLPRWILGAVAALWLGSFTALWSLSASEVASEEAFAEYWQNAFLPIPPTAARDLGLLARAPFDLFGAGFHARYAHPTGDFAPFLGALLVWLGALGAILCFREDRTRLGFWLAPIGMAVMASALGFYPFLGRFLLVFTPCVVLLAARGWSALEFGRGLAATVLLGLTLLSTSQLYLRPQPAEQTRQAITALAERMQAGDTLLVHSRSLAGFLYYSQYDPRCALPNGITVIEGALALEGTPGLLQTARGIEGRGRVWLLFEEEWSAVHPSGVLGAALEERAPRVESAWFEGTQIHRFDFSEADSSPSEGSPPQASDR